MELAKARHKSMVPGTDWPKYSDARNKMTQIKLCQKLNGLNIIGPETE